MNGERMAMVAGVLALALAAPMARAADGHNHGGHGHGTVAAGAKDDHAPAGPQVSLEGEIVDLHCFLLHPETGQGKEHIKCAQMCMNKGLPIGFKSADGSVYLLLGPGHDAVKAKVVALAGVPVTLTGVVVAGAPLKAIQLSSVTRAGAAAAAEAKPASKPVTKDVWMCPMGCVKSDKPGKCSACGMDMEKKKG